MKDKGVCKGCKYYIEHSTTPYFVGLCDYLDATGKSRMVIEQENGGVKQDSCICYEPKKRNKEVGWKWKNT